MLINQKKRGYYLSTLNLKEKSIFLHKNSKLFKEDPASLKRKGVMLKTFE